MAQLRRGGKYRERTVFRTTPAGRLTYLHRFCARTNCADGDQPDSGLALGSDGNFYGTPSGDPYIYYGGTVFETSPNRHFQTYSTTFARRVAVLTGLDRGI